MRRIIYVVVATSLAAAGAFSAAQAKQILPRHSQDVQKTVTAAFRSVAISGDSNITLRPGRVATVRVHEEWNFYQPAFSVSVSHGVLNVSVSCTDQHPVGPADIEGVVEPVDDCTDDLTVVVPSTHSVQADTAFGNIVVSGFRNGLKLTTSSGDITVGDSSGRAVDASSGNGKVAASAVRADAVNLNSDSGDVAASRLTANSLTAKSGDGAVTVKSAKTTVLTAASDAGNVDVSDSTVDAQADVHSGQGTVGVTRVATGSLSATSDSGDVSVTDVTGKALSLSTGDGTATVDRVRSHDLVVNDDSGNVNVSDAVVQSADLTSNQGDVTVRKVSAQTAKLDSQAGTISASLTRKPQTVVATDGDGDVNIDVPTGRYDVQADSGQGTVSVTGLIIDTSVKPYIRAHSDSGNVTVHGH